jgi:hypothetical protein
MTESLQPDLLRQVWEYPLFDALYGRRSRRFGLGFEMAEGRLGTSRATTPSL